MSGVTQGWDAVLAMNAAQVSAVFRQQYLQDGPTNPVNPVRIVFTDNTDLMVLDVVLGPPEFSFSVGPGESAAELSMVLVSGGLYRVDPMVQPPVVRSVLPVEPNSAWLAGPVELSQVEGTDDVLGEVVLHLASGAYKPTIAGIDPSSTLATGLVIALQTYFETQKTTYSLGRLVLTSVPAYLQPTTFEIILQSAAGATGDGAVVVLIQTTGQRGQVVPLGEYPIPAGDTAALIVAGNVLCGDLLASSLTDQFANIGTTFTAQSSNGDYEVVGSGGTIDLGGFPTPQPTDIGIPYTSDLDGYYQSVQLSPTAFTVQPSGGNLVATWTSSFSQHWTEVENASGGITVPETNQADMIATFTITFAGSADPSGNKVTFSGTGSFSMQPQTTENWYSKWFKRGLDLPDQMQSAFGAALQQVLGNMELPSVDTFALENLFFPSSQVLRLSTVSVPADLWVRGQIEPPLSVTPGNVTLTPGGSQQFTAMLADSTVPVTWEAQCGNLWTGFGGISAGGLYTAPATLAQPLVVVITAVDADSEKANVVGRAMVVLTPSPPTDLVVSPNGLILTASQSYPLLVTDDGGTPVAADCSIAPAVGTLTQGFTTGTWIYQAPASIAAPETLTVTAKTSSGGAIGQATIHLVPTAGLTVIAWATTVTAGRTLTLTALSDTLENFTWVTLPTGMGSIQPKARETVTAVYTAPASVTAEKEVTVIAYGCDPDVAVGVGLVRIIVQPG